MHAQSPLGYTFLRCVIILELAKIIIVYYTILDFLIENEKDCSKLVKITLLRYLIYIAKKSMVACMEQFCLVE